MQQPETLLSIEPEYKLLLYPDTFTTELVVGEHSISFQPKDQDILDVIHTLFHYIISTPLPVTPLLTYFQQLKVSEIVRMYNNHDT